MIATIIAALAALSLQSTAEEFVTACQAYQAENGGTSDCVCLGDAVAADESLAAEFQAISTPEDVANASDAAKAAIAACAPSEAE